MNDNTKVYKKYILLVCGAGYLLAAVGFILAYFFGGTEILMYLIGFGVFLGFLGVIVGIVVLWDKS
jgi:hypothetical protein